ncbi:MAG: DUF6265 family protein [Alphaproteobacteria bacterium]
MFRVLVFLLVAAPLATAPAQAAKLKDLGWLAGHWAASGEGHVEEIWSEPRAGVMTGMFRLVMEGKPAVLEYVVISEEKDGVFLRFKHFRPDFSTWEGDNPPITMKLTEAKEGRAIFKNVMEAENQPPYVSYLLGEDGALTVLVNTLPDEAEKGETLKFILTRQ